MTREAVRVAVRTLRRQPGFSLVVIVSLALAISLNTTMYAMLDSLIHPRVDIRDPSTLYRANFYGDFKQRVPVATRDSLLRAAPSIEGVAWFSGPTFVTQRPLRAGDQVAEAPIGRVSREYFELMGPRVVAGRIFTRDDEQSAARPLVLSEMLVPQLFAPGANPIGARVVIDSAAYVVVGVLSQYADFPQQHTGFVNFSRFQAGAWVLGAEAPRALFTRAIRVRPGVTRQQLERDLAVVSERIAIAAGEPPRDDAFRLGGTTLEQIQIRGLHLALVFAVVAVLLIACANVANMQLARGIGRRRELALRSALGASRRGLVGHLVLESAVLGATGLVLGLAMTYWFSIALSAAVPPEVGRYIVEPRFSWRVLAFAIGATIGCILLVGLAPALRVSSVDPNELLKSGAGTGASRRHRRQYGYLVVVEIGVSLALLCACGVSVQSAIRLRASRVGYDPAPLAVGVYRPAPLRRGEARAEPQLLLDAVGRARALDGVAGAAASMFGSFDGDSLALADSSGVRWLAGTGSSYRVVSPAYVRTMGLPIIRGRDFREGELDAGAIIIDEYTARKLWPNANPVGALIKLGGARSTRPFVRVVGVTGQYDARGEIAPMDMADRNGASFGAIYYLPTLADSAGPAVNVVGLTVVARTTGDPAAVATAMRRAGFLHAQTMVDYLGITAARATMDFMAGLFTMFAALALALGAFGVYGVVAHTVAERRRELGVRIALGATARDILHAVLRETVVIGLAGIAAGLALVMMFIGPVSAFAYYGDVQDAPLFAGIAALMFGVAALSAFIPARRATRVDPTESLRCE